MAKRREIRNSTAEFLIFQIEGKEQGVEVYYKDKTVWCTQKAMGMLFDCTSDNISVHLQNIYDTDELKREATTEKISVVRREGNRDVNCKHPCRKNTMQTSFTAYLHFSKSCFIINDLLKKLMNSTSVAGSHKQLCCPAPPRYVSAGCTWPYGRYEKANQSGSL